MSKLPAQSTDPLLWRLEAIVLTEDADALEDALSEKALSVSRFELPDKGLWRLDALFHDPPDPGPFNALLEKQSKAGDGPIPTVSISRLPKQDWVSLSLEGLKPITAGRFFVSGRHDAVRAPANAVAIQIEAGPAFGTGHHMSTFGCLLAIEKLARRYQAQAPLDLGCGSGVLGIAMAKVWRSRVIAADIDPAAVRTTLENAKINGVGHNLRAVTANGLGHRLLTLNAPYDVIVANILAGPLRKLAPAIVRHIDDRGFVILSGILASQEREVTAAYANRGLVKWQRLLLDGWVTLTFRRRRGF